MRSNTKTAVIRDEVKRQIYGSFDEKATPANPTSYEGLGKEQNILTSLQQNLSELSDLESKLNFMVKEVKFSLKSR